jgi:hypothetical protein
MDSCSRSRRRVDSEIADERSAYERLRDERVAELAMRLKPVQVAANDL